MEQSAIENIAEMAKDDIDAALWCWRNRAEARERFQSAMHHIKLLLEEYSGEGD